VCRENGTYVTIFTHYGARWFSSRQLYATRLKFKYQRLERASWYPIEG